MLVNNFHKYMYGYMSGNTAYITMVNGGAGSITASQLLQYGFPFKKYGKEVQTVYIALGSSSLAPADTDHCIGTDVTASLTLVGGNVSNAVISGTGYVCSITATFRNDTAADVSVSEIGAYIYHNVGVAYFMVSRDVIETVTIRPGKTATFTVTITL